MKKISRFYLAFGLFLLAGGFLHAQQNRPGLYVGDTFQGAMDIADAVDWITLNGQNGGNYTIVLASGKEQAISSVELSCGGKTVGITLKSAGAASTLTYATRSPSYSLFTVKTGVTFTLENNVILKGLQSASRTMVIVDGGVFVMNGGVIKDSMVQDTQHGGGGVRILKGAFTMNGGTISGNQINATWGGLGTEKTGGSAVCVDGSDAMFTMNGGTLSGNTAYSTYALVAHSSAAVFVVGGTFTMTNGSISNNRDRGIYIGDGGKSTMSGGIVKESREVYIDSRGIFTISGGRIEQTAVSVVGNFIMNSGTISKNYERGVYLNGGTFQMNGGTISGNLDGGVYGGGTFIMTDGTISGNSTEGNGGGVYCRGEFTMSGGIISGNTAGKSGGGVYCDFSTFTKSGTAGVIYGSDAPPGQANKAYKYGHAVHTNNGSRDTTARTTMALDSTKEGKAGGWE